MNLLNFFRLMTNLREFENDCETWLKSEMRNEEKMARIGDETASDDA